jgi:glycosyltransferase involved in cell wall biosynthesis
MIPISVIVMTKNEAANLPHCLPPLIKNFNDVHVVDSDSTDNTTSIARDHGATVTHFKWNGQYPKKKQWCLDTIKTHHDWVLMIDADEIITDAFVAELQNFGTSADGYFVRSDMVWKDRHLHHGQKNNKLCLFKKSSFTYPVINDLNMSGGWEVEGHYQPIATTTHTPHIQQITSPIIHHDRKQQWHDRHDNYVMWEAEMTKKGTWPRDPVFTRESIKDVLRTSRLRPFIYFIYSYVIKCGFLDGKMGFDYALNRYRYNARIAHAIRRTNVSR